MMQVLYNNTMYVILTRHQLLNQKINDILLFNIVRFKILTLTLILLFCRDKNSHLLCLIYLILNIYSIEIRHFSHQIALKDTKTLYLYVWYRLYFDGSSFVTSSARYSTKTSMTSSGLRLWTSSLQNNKFHCGILKVTFNTYFLLQGTVL